MIKKPETVQVGLRIPKTLRDQFERMARDDRRSLNSMVQIAMEDYVRRQKEVKP